MNCSASPLLNAYVRWSLSTNQSQQHSRWRDPFHIFPKGDPFLIIAPFGMSQGLRCMSCLGTRSICILISCLLLCFAFRWTMPSWCRRSCLNRIVFPFYLQNHLPLCVCQYLHFIICKEESTVQSLAATFSNLQSFPPQFTTSCCKSSFVKLGPVLFLLFFNFNVLSSYWEYV